MTQVTELFKKGLKFEDVKKHLVRTGQLITKDMTRTPSETVFGRKLVEAGIPVHPQFRLGEFEYDFRIVGYNIIAEIDGGIHKDDAVIARDYIKWRYAAQNGYTLIRFTNAEAHNGKLVEEVKNVMAGCKISPAEVWLVKYTILDWIKDKWKGVRR